MRFLLLGCGLVGYAIAYDLIKSEIVSELVILDKSENRLRSVIRKLGSNKVSYIIGDASDTNTLLNIMKDADIVIGALPGLLGFNAVKTSIEAGVSIVDISYMPENPLILDLFAKQRNVLVIPDAGLAPGLSNLLVGHAVSFLDIVDRIRILVGGLPQRRISPLEHCTTWSVYDLIEEYTRPARIIRNGRITEVQALTGLEKVYFKDVGELEAFYTDGLRTLLYTIKARDMEEKTLRYPGHVEKIRLLIDLGFFGSETIEIRGATITPKEFSIKVLEKKLICKDEKDLVVMRVIVKGKKEDENVEIVYDLIDYYDEKESLTAMSRTTGFTASVVSQLVAQGYIKGKGVVPLELLGQNHGIFSAILRELEKRGIRIKTEIRN